MALLDALLAIITNPAVIIPASAWIIAQILKAIINACVTKQFSFSRLVGDGGMPSGHSATVAAVAFTSGWMMGYDSVVFAVSAILAIIVMHDAMGIRREAGKQAASIKQIAELINELVEEKDDVVRTDKLKELVGHTPLQVILGGLLGVAIGVASVLIFGTEYGSGVFSVFA